MEIRFIKPGVVKGIIEAFDEEQPGNIFSVVIQKKDGTLRRMVCRTGVKKNLKGGENSHKHHPENITVFDTEADDYRCFSSERVLRIKGCGTIVEACAVGEIDAPILNAAGEEVKVR